jgi:hypothetical protein
MSTEENQIVNSSSFVRRTFKLCFEMLMLVLKRRGVAVGRELSCKLKILCGAQDTRKPNEAIPYLGNSIRRPERAQGIRDRRQQAEQGCRDQADSQPRLKEQQVIC